MTDFEQLLTDLIDATTETARREHHCINVFDAALLDHDRNLRDRIEQMMTNHEDRRDELASTLQAFAMRLGYTPPEDRQVAQSSTVGALPHQDQIRYKDWDNPHGISYRKEA